MDNTRKDILTDKMKDYLVGISKIEEQKPVARIGEIATILGVKGSSAHVMVKTLAKSNMVRYEKYGYVTLTEEGREIAEELINKNNIIRNFLIRYLGIDEKTAIDDANKIKNTLSKETFAKLKKFIYFLENRPDHKDINCPQEVEAFSKT